MPPEATLQPALLLIAAGLMALACWHDLATRTLPDSVAIALALLGLAWQFTFGQPGWSILAAVLVFIGAALVWRLGALGGGDVKMLAACALLPNASAVPMLLVVTALAGGILALAYLAAQRLAPAGPAEARLLPARVWRVEARRMRRGGPLPYAFAITLGTLFSMMERI